MQLNMQLYLYNLVPHKSINDKIPNELYYNNLVDLKYLKIFGYIAFYKILIKIKKNQKIIQKKDIYLYK